jgi:hypothetical protein
MSKSRIEFSDDGTVRVLLGMAPRLLGCWAGRTLEVPSGNVVGVWQSSSEVVGKRLRWKIAGAAISRQRAMGWFSWIGHSGRWAWIWITPHRRVFVIETSRRKPALIVVPMDWAEAAGDLAGSLPEWSG